MNNNKAGKYAELFARILFLFKGFLIVEQNYKTGKGTHAGEIDFIAKRGKLLVFVEVKKRSTIDSAAYAISNHQQERIINGAKAFLRKNPIYADYDIRFDAVLVKFPFCLKHIQNAWQAD